MAYFRSFFGGGNEAEEESGVEIVEKLVERVETCTDGEDRRDALRALRSMAKNMRVAVGSMGMNAFMSVLEKERENHELVSLTIDILNAVLSNEDDRSEEDELGERFAEVLIKKPTFMPSLLASIAQFDFSVRRTAIQLMTSLLRHRGHEVQSSVMGQATGVPCLIDSLHDNREVVRNEAVLMLCELSRNNSQIQQLLAYDNAFVLLLDIIQSEPLDSIVVEDSLFVILNLLRKNGMNQQIFRENNLIYRLNDLLDVFIHGTGDEPEGGDWPKQRTANLIFLLQVIRSLVSPDNIGTNTHAAQKAIHHCKMLSTLCHVLLSETGVSVEVLTESVIAVAECIRGNYTNQEYFASCSLPLGEQNSRPALLVLLISMTAEKQPFKLRCAVFYCFLSYLNENEFGKTKIVDTLLSSNQSDAALTTGGMICQALTSSESVQTWFGSVSLLHCLLNVTHLREQLLRVQLTMVIDEPPISLLTHLTNQLVSYGNRRVQSRIGILMLLCVWLTECPPAIAVFSANHETMQHLTTQIVDECGEGSESELQVAKGLMAFLLLTCLQSIGDETARRSLEQLLDRRVGRDLLVTCVEGVSRTEQFVRAAQKPQPLAKFPGELCLDFHFIKLFKQHEASLIKTIRSNGDFSTSNSDGIIQSFKELIKRQDEEISVLKQDAKRLSAENEQLKQEAADRGSANEIDRLRAELEQVSMKSKEDEGMRMQIHEMQRVNEQWRAEAEKYKQWAQQWQQYQIAQLPSARDEFVAQLERQLAEVEQQLAHGYEAYEQQANTLLHTTTQCAQLRERVAALESAANRPPLQNGIEHTGNESAELSKLRGEQEDLLVLLADQHNKMSSYRARLRQAGQTVTDDEDDE